MLPLHHLAVEGVRTYGVLRHATLHMQIQPVLCGSALRGIGVQPVLDAVAAKFGIGFTWDAFEPVAMLTRTSPIIGANKNVPWKDATELVAAAKKAPGTILTGGTLGDIRNAADDAGLQVPTTIFLKGWWDTSGEDYDKEIDEIKRRLEQTVAVGAGYAIGGPPLGEVDFELGARQYARLLEVGREFGVKPIMSVLSSITMP